MIKEKLQKLRELLKNHNFDGYMIATQDEYLSEYVPASARRLEYITGFSGSNGLAIILPEICLFFTDGRYLTQSKMELDQNLFKIFDQSEISSFPFTNYINKHHKIAFDPRLFSAKSLKFWANQNFSLLPFAQKNFIDEIWKDTRPPKPNSPVQDYPEKYAGKSYADKIEKCRRVLQEQNAEGLVITSPDSTCWLLNLRAHDVEFSPILLAYSIVTMDKIYLFASLERFSDELLKNRKDITILPESEFAQIIQNINSKILYDENLSSSYVATIISSKEHKVVNDPCQLWKACKNDVEIESMKQGHIEDAIAVCEFLAFIEHNQNLSSLSEYDLGKILTEYRTKRPNYVMDSFPAICGYQDNGAVIHYRADKSSAKKITGSGLLLIDSGGQYLGATTDITRVIAIGKQISKEHVYYYTKVLKGHIALAMAKFPNKVSGANLDILARQYLWQDGKDYAHGTGHGVGSYLNVHEGPASINLINLVPIAKGMVLSNEPGYYVPGEFGIRIENLIYTKEAENNFLEFEALTLVPYAKSLIDQTMLSISEKEFLSSYYHKISKTISPFLSEQAQKWLQKEITEFL